MMRMRPKLVAAACAMIAVVIIAASPAQARNRTTQMMVADIASGAGVDSVTVTDAMDTLTQEDRELLPGLFHSLGGIAYSYGGEGITTLGIRLYNESDVAICVRADSVRQGGSVDGFRQGGSLGYNFLLEPGASEFVIVNTINRDLDLESVGRYATRYYFWKAAPASIERRCSSIEPADLASWMAEPLPPPGELELLAAPELSASLGL
jgi:hypothetical protein